MPLDAKFFEIAEPLRVPSMGTEHVALLLYSLVSMLRPRSVLEIGAGYTTLFLARALADAKSEADRDRNRTQAESAGDQRLQILSDEALRDYQPCLYVIDDLSYPDTSSSTVENAFDRLGVADIARFITANFRGASRLLPASAVPVDFVWFDCGAATDAGVTFLNEYWPLVNENGGVIAFHSLHVALKGVPPERSGFRIPSPLLNELRKRQVDAGRRRQFELVSLVEPHKILQGDVTILTKVGGLNQIRDLPFEEDAIRFGGFTADHIIQL